MRGYTKKQKIKFIAVAGGIVVGLTTVGGGVAYAYNTPYSYVSLDVNPSIEYSVNIFDKVIDANAVNEDGEAILSNIDIENEPIEEAIKNTVSEISKQGYIKDGEIGGIVISTSSENDNRAEALAYELEAEAKEVVIENNLQAEVESLSIGKERVERAKELGVTPGKLNLVEKLQKSAANPEDISVEEWLNKPVKEIMKATKVNREEQKAKTKESITEESTIDNKDQGEEASISEAANVQNKVEDSDKEVNEKKASEITEKKENDNKEVEKKNVSNASIEKKNKSNSSIQKNENKKEDKKDQKNKSSENEDEGKEKGKGK
ncbi:hypothetical protein NNC19_21305 [Clostridium sp. SHJSY1]|uniref:anti-sigma-I factor RsgI family protein n=1 Tax=Clostridium sp. SHJSY1 TaxID=2942483 RepID=UPI00287641E2|nr:hypothetical protein [Clostridium sp. SHJSY1]MDS0528228.1 hypothetical protein [Clostridium sp. SHJSY1]